MHAQIYFLMTVCVGKKSLALLFSTVNQRFLTGGTVWKHFWSSWLGSKGSFRELLVSSGQKPGVLLNALQFTEQFSLLAHATKHTHKELSCGLKWIWETLLQAVFLLPWEMDNKEVSLAHFSFSSHLRLILGFPVCMSIFLVSQK